MMMNQRKYVSQRRNGYGAVDEYADGKCQRTVMAGIKPMKDADAIAGALNEAYWKGQVDAAHDVLDSVSMAVDSTPSHGPAGKQALATVTDYVVNHYGEV